MRVHAQGSGEATEHLEVPGGGRAAGEPRERARINIGATRHGMRLAAHTRAAERANASPRLRAARELSCIFKGFAPAAGTLASFSVEAAELQACKTVREHGLETQAISLR